MEYIKTPGPYDPTLVQEFYASMIPTIFNQFYTVVIRGVPVRFSMEDICSHFHMNRPNNLGMHYGVSPIPGVARSETHSPIIASSLRRNENPRWETVNAELGNLDVIYQAQHEAIHSPFLCRSPGCTGLMLHPTQPSTRHQPYDSA